MSEQLQSSTPPASLDTDHAGIKLVIHADAFDHANMRALQLAALLRVISGPGADTFLAAGRATQDGVLWLASSLADDVERVLPLIDAANACQERDAKTLHEVTP